MIPARKQPVYARDNRRILVPGFFLFLMLAATGIVGFGQNKNYDPDHRFSIRELQADFKYLRAKLEKIHPDLYLYTAKAELDLFLDSLYNSIAAPSTEQEFYNRVTLLNSKIKDGHTMFLPSDAARDYFNTYAVFFPFYVILSDRRMYVNMNCSTDTLIKEGAEIERINGITVKEILDRLLERQIRDGENQTYPAWILTNYFKDYFGFTYGHPDSYIIQYRNRNDSLQSVVIRALPRDSIQLHRRAKYAARLPVTGDKQGIRLTIDPQPGVALLTIQSFDKNLLKTMYKQEFKRSIDDLFKQVYDRHIRHLVLDIRNNQGGDFESGRILLSWLIREPLEYLKNSPEYRLLMPYKNNFTGNLYVLINGGSFSNSGIISSYLEATGRAVFIGEEAAGNKIVICGDPGDGLLPNTKIAVQLSSKKYTIREATNDGHGVMPAYPIIPTIDEISDGRDRAKEFVLDLIAKGKNE